MRQSILMAFVKSFDQPNKISLQWGFSTKPRNLISYYKGEWLEAGLLAAFGATLAGVTLTTGLYTDPSSLIEGFSYSMACLAVSTLFAGAFQLYSNSRRLANMPAQYAQNPKAFVQAELNRFEGRAASILGGCH
ncbi:MAG: hypothetical protein ACRCWB_06110 [Enterovibrio sp.]